MRVRGSLVSLAAVFAVVASLLPAVAAARTASIPVSSKGAAVLAGPQDGERAAMAAARSSGERVEDRSRRDAYSRVFANPDGTWTAEIHSSPVRVRDAGGAWHAVDTRLVARDGGLSAAYAAADVVFSAGGDRTFASLTVDGQTLRWQWPSVLPEPVVEGDTATYREVVRGGDLVVTATSDGFSHDLVLREAPEGPVEFAMPVVTGDATLSETPDGGLKVASADGELLAWAPAPVMWDAATDADGDPANVAEVGVGVDATAPGTSTLTLSPDAGFLSDPDTVYPVTIDPTYSVRVTDDGWISSADVTAPAHPQDEELRVGTTDSGATKHQAYLRFLELSPVMGKEVLSADLVLRNFDALSCQHSPIRVRKITSSWHLIAGHPDSLRWNNQPNIGADFADYRPAHGAGPSCPTGNGTWPVAFAVQSWVSGGDNYGLRLSAAEPNQNASWRQYRSDNFADWWRRPQLVVVFNEQPTVPTELGLVKPCVGDCSAGVSGSLTPTLSARSTDPDDNPLWYEFEVAPADSTTPVATGTVGPVAEGTKVEWTVPGGKLADNAAYRYRVRADDRKGDGGAGFDGSAYSDWVGFTTDPDVAPSMPTGLAVAPCSEGGCAAPWVTPSLNPELTATVADADSDSLDVTFEVRRIVDGQPGPTFPQGEGSGGDLVAADEATHTFDTARFTVPSGVLVPGGVYEFRVGASDGTTTTFTNSWTRFRVAAETEPSLQLAEPLVVWDHGPTLTWSAYRDAPDVSGDDLVEYQIFRGCLTAVAADEDCPLITEGDDFAAIQQDLELVATVTRDELSWTDESARPSAWGTNGTVNPAKYQYWIVARTLDDVAQHKDGTIASNPWTVQTPTEGRVRRILTGEQATADATLSSGQSTTTYDEALRVGAAHTDGSTDYGTERAVLSFDLSAVGDRRVTEASLEVYQRGGGPATATTATRFDLHALNRHFVEHETTWTRAASGVDWASPGGDYSTEALDSVLAAGGDGDQRLVFTGLRSTVQGWAATDQQANHGVLIKAADEGPGAAQQWLELEPSEPTEATAVDPEGKGTAPRLVVEHLIKEPGQTIEAPHLPQRILPGSTETVDVTVTNTTGQAWPADFNMRLSYRWTFPGQTEDQTGFTDDRYFALEEPLQPGESTPVELRLRAPINSDTGANRPEWDLYLDLYYNDNGTDRWWSDTHPYTTETVDPDERAQGLCEMVALGLLCPDRLVQSSPSSEIGLEESGTYVGDATGAGSQVLTNLHTGNLVWSYNAFANPSVGPSMFLRVAYNSQDTVATGAGFGWSVQPATLSRLGNRLTVANGGDTVTLIDGDGTSHTWRRHPIDGLFRHPPGVALDLTSTGTAADGTWLFTRPDGTQFAYLRSDDNTIDGRAMWVEDVSGQKLTFHYDNAADPDRLTSLTDAKGRIVGTLDYYDNGKLRYVQDISGRTVQFTYDVDGKLVTLEDGGDYIPAADGTSPGSYGGAVKRFQFVYNTGSTSSNTRMTSITGPRLGVTSVEYWDTTESYNGTPVESAVDGWVESVTDRRGQTTIVDYRDRDGSEGKFVNATVDAEVDPGEEPEVSHYVVDSFGRATTITDPNDHITHLGWDSDHSVVRLTEPNGAVSRWQYDRDTGYPVKIWDPEAVDNGTDPTVLEYGSAGRATVLTSITTPLGSLTPDEPNDYTTTFGYDAVGRLLSVTDPRGTLTENIPDDFVTTYTYNADGTLATVTDANDNVTTYSYGTPQVGYPTRITPPPDSGPGETPIAPTDFTYDARGNVTATTQTGAGQTVETSTIYDDFGRPTSITTTGAQGGPRTTTFDYDVNDNVLTTTAPNSAVTTSTYTVDDLLDTQILPANTEPAGADRVVSYDYFLTGRLKSQTSPRGNVSDYDYDAVGQLLSVTRHDGTTPVITSYGYDEAGNRISVVDPNTNAAGAGETTLQLVYDLNHRVVTAIDALGFATRTRYDADGQKVADIDQRGNPTTYTYTPAGQVKTITVEHTPLGESRAHERITSFDYDPVGNRTRVTRPSGRFEQTVYDANNRPVEQRSAFDPGDTNPDYRTPAVTYLGYDALGRLLRQSAPTWDPAQKDWTSFSYWPSGEVATSTDPWGIAASYEYNKLGQQTKRTLKPSGSSGTADDRVMTWDYYPDGSLHTRDDNVPATTARRVDNTDRGFAADPGDEEIWARITPATDDGQIGGNYRVHAAAAAGSGGAEDSATWTFTLPQSGQYGIQVSCPANAHLEEGVGVLSTAAAYTIGVDGQNTQATVNQQAGCPTQVWHTLADRQVPGGSQITITLHPSADGAVVADAVRVINKNTGRAFTYSYDPDGNQTGIVDTTAGARVAEYTTSYDDLGRPTQVQELTGGGSVLRSTDYGYDLNGNVTSVTATRSPDPAGAGEDRANLAASRTTSYEWDARNLVTELTTSTSGPEAARTWTYTYNPAGMLKTLTKPDTGAGGAGNSVVYTYYEGGQLRTEVERRASGGIVSSHQLWYTADGDKSKDLSRVDNADADPGVGDLRQTVNYDYTPTRKLERVTKHARVDEGPAEHYVYDAAGNIVEQTIANTTTRSVYDRNRLLSSTVNNGPTHTYSYDAFGRLTGAAGGGQAVEYTYDGFDRLTRQVTESGAGANTTIVDTAYDPLDRVTLQITDTGANTTTRTRFGYLGLSEQVAVEEQRDGTGAWQQVKAYAYSPAGRPVSLDATPLTGEDKTRYYSYNPHGDVEALTNPDTGETTATYRYTAYGNADRAGTTGEDAVTGDPAADADILNPYRYSGHRYNAATGDYDFGFRNYDPGLNRFLTRDMYNGALSDLALGLDPWNTNRYTLAGGNPTTYIDLDGHINDVESGWGDAFLVPEVGEETRFDGTVDADDSLKLKDNQYLHCRSDLEGKCGLYSIVPSTYGPDDALDDATGAAVVWTSKTADSVNIFCHIDNDSCGTAGIERWLEDHEIDPNSAVGTGTQTALTGVSIAGAVAAVLRLAKAGAGLIAAGSTATNTGNDVVRALTSAERRTLDDALRPDKLDHVFDPKHNFDPLVQQFGSREAVMEQFVRNIGGPLPQAGRFEVVRSIGGQTVTIRGAVVDGIPRIGTAFTP